MSSLYYANALFSKYPAAGSVFAAGAFPEQTSCAFASSPQRAGYGAGAGAPFAASVQGLYPGGGGMAGPAAAGVYAAGYGLEPGSFNMHCAPCEQSLSGVCPGEPAKAAAAQEQRDSDLAAESNFRIYPWMRSSGNAAHRALPRRSGLGAFPGGRPLPGREPLSASTARAPLPAPRRQEVGPGGARHPPRPRPGAPPPPRFCLVLSGSLSLRPQHSARVPQLAPHPSSQPFSFKYLSAAPAKAGGEAVCLAEEG